MNTIISSDTGIKILDGNALVSKNTITASSGSGIEVQFGSPTIESNTIVSGWDTGIYVIGGTPSINSNVINSNVTGIYLQGGDAQISGNTIANNSSYGIVYSFGNPSITLNTITSNDIGVYIFPPIATLTLTDNRIYCNNTADLYSLVTSPYSVAGNAWDHDSATAPTGPTTSTTCSAGVDICYSLGAPLPTYSPFNAAVSGGCL